MMRAVLITGVAALALSACTWGSRPGGYYEDDGPGRRHVDIDAIPEPVPVAEPLSPSGNAPYTVFGKTYRPMREAGAYRERGIASWYGKKFHGRRTSSGETYDMYAMSAAHKTLPLPSYVRVTNLRNGRSVIVRVNDRGPFLHNRLIDLSYAAAMKLDIVRTGTGLVEVSAIDTAAPATAAARKPGAAAEPPRIWLQVGAFSSRDNAENLRTRVARTAGRPVVIRSELVNDTRIYRVRIGPIDDVAESDRLALHMMDYGIDDAHVVIE